MTTRLPARRLSRRRYIPVQQAAPPTVVAWLVDIPDCPVPLPTEGQAEADTLATRWGGQVRQATP